MKIITKLSRAKVVAGQGHDLELLMRLRAPAGPSAQARRPPIGVILVIDVSGSMEGAKLEAVKRALGTLLGHLVPGDHAALVTFDTEVQRLSSLVEVTERQKAGLQAMVRQLRAGSSTNLAGGLLEGLAIAQGPMPEGLRTRVILLTDGHANHGVAHTHDELVALLREHGRGSTVSAFGLGDDCDQTLLAALAEVGGGSYAYLANEEVVLSAFARELGGLVATYAAGVKITVTPAAGAPTVLAVGDLLYQATHTASVPIAISAHPVARDVEVCRVEASWKDRGGRPEQAQVVAHLEFVAAGQEDAADDPEVARLRDERLLAAAMDEAERHARAGEFQQAAKVIDAVVSRLGDPVLLAFARDKLAAKYRDSTRYARSAGARASLMTSFKRRRMVAAAEDVHGMFDIHASAAEAAMEESFKKGEGNGGKDKKDEG